MAVPIYEFSCLTCRHTFDVFGNYAARDERQICPECEGTNTKAMFSTFAVTGPASESSSTSGAGGCACGGSCSCSN